MPLILGVLFKISDEYPHHFYRGVSPRGLMLYDVVVSAASRNEIYHLWGEDKEGILNYLGGREIDKINRQSSLK